LLCPAFANLWEQKTTHHHPVFTALPEYAGMLMVLSSRIWSAPLLEL